MLALRRAVAAAAAQPSSRRPASAGLPALAAAALSSSSGASAAARPKISAASQNSRDGGGGGSSSGSGSKPPAVGASAALALAGLSLAVGYAAGRASSTPPPHAHVAQDRVLPSGLPRACCSCEDAEAAKNPPPLTEEQRSLPERLSKIVGGTNVLPGSTSHAASAPYLKGARLGEGSALAIVRPQSLRQAIDCLRLIVQAGCTVVPQGKNTGLTGGSVPRNDDDEDGRPSVVLSTRDLDVAFPIDGGERVVCLAGVGISDLSRYLSEWGFPDRECHSVLGSVFLNPTTAAGVAFGSGGTQLRKGPARTDRALWATVDRDKWGETVVRIHNTLGIEGIEDADFLPGKGNALEQLDVYAKDVRQGYRRGMGKSSGSRFGTAPASDVGYSRRVCETDSAVSRYNADTSGADCNRSEGKVLILATVHDTFPRAERSRTYWVSFADLDTALAFRREVCLDEPDDLPVSVEYMDRDSFDVIDGAGRVTANLIKVIGTGHLMGRLWDLKLWIEALPLPGAPLFCDRVLHALNGVMPPILPPRVMEAGRRMDHHVAMTVGEYGGGTLDRTLERMERFVKERGEDNVRVYECDGRGEEASLNAFRFVATTAFRTWCVGNGMQGISIDYALPKDGGDVPDLEHHPRSAGAAGGGDGGGAAPSRAAVPVKRMRYSHFGCNVVHEDLAYEAAVDVHAAKMALKRSVEFGSGGRLPAEHGHGTEYHAPKEAQERWKRMDPLNVLNPGIGGLSSRFRYRD